MPDKEKEGIKFQDYFEHHEHIKSIPSHRALALLRGRREGFLKLNLQLSAEEEQMALQKIAASIDWRHQNRPADDWLAQTIQWTWKIKLLTKLELDLMNNMRESAGAEAIEVFASNLKNLLMAAPAGMRVTLALDPGFRTGVKVAVLDKTGKLLTFTTIFPHVP